MAHPAQRRWYPLVFVIAALVLLPLSVLLLSWQSIDTQIWSHMWDTQMPRLLGNTLTLIVGVGVGVTLLGVEDGKTWRLFEEELVGHDKDLLLGDEPIQGAEDHTSK